MVAVNGGQVAGSAELSERDVRRWLKGLQLWHAARLIVIVEFVVTIAVSATAVTTPCSAEHPSICGPSTLGDWAVALALLTVLLLLTAPGFGSVSGICVGLLGAGNDPTLAARGWWAAGAALSLGLLVSLLLIRHRQRQVGAARRQPVPPSADGIAPTRVRLRDWAVVPGVLAIVGLVAMGSYSLAAADTHSHEQIASRATAIVQERHGDKITLGIDNPAGPDQTVAVGVLDASIYHVGDRVPVLVDSSGDEPWVRLVAEPDDPTTPRLVALICFVLAGAYLVLRARRWWVRRGLATRDLPAISVSVRRWSDDGDVVAVFVADGSGRPAALLRIIASNEIADPETGRSSPSSGPDGPGDPAHLIGQFWYGGVVRMRSRECCHVADAMVRLPRWTLIESWVRRTRDFRKEFATRQPPPDDLSSDSSPSPPRSSAPPHPDLAAGTTRWQPPPDDLSSDDVIRGRGIGALTAEAIRHARFATSRAMGAYDTDEVATFLERVAAAVDGGDKTRTVELIRAVTFNGPPRRKPGYDPDAVDSYLRRLAAMFAPAGEPDPVEVVTPSSSETAAGRI